MTACTRVFIVFIFMLYLQTLTVNSTTLKPRICDGENECCFGYTWDEDLQGCKKCRTGYYDLYCNMSCPYPHYGTDCDEECQCEQQTCNFITGCLVNTTNIHASSDQSSTDTFEFFTIVTTSSTENELSLKSLQRSPSPVNQIISFSLRDFLLYIAGVLLVLILFTVINVFICKRRAKRNYAIFNEKERKCALIESKDAVKNTCRGNTKIIISHCTENNSCFLEITTDKGNTDTKNSCFSNTEVDKEKREQNRKGESIDGKTQLHLCTIKPLGQEETIYNMSQCSQYELDCYTDVKEVSDENQLKTTTKVSHENEYISVPCCPDCES
ncbi:uncharacterized protein LOC134258193 isoform X1 [Saccostrea cucullata]|uniref:uncharacterized protein LOC134258193 isoform X1 n=1 Tax=Saccostrea cuccullata TaxID=36930 RepID=UPI002ED4D773